MGRQCVLCGKGTVSGKQVSHAHVRTPRRWLPNLQKIRVIIDGSPRRANVCTKCLKSGKVKRAL